MDEEIKIEEEKTGPHHEVVQHETISVQTAPSKDRLLPISILIAAVLIGGSVIFATIYKGGNQAPAPSGNGGDATTTNTAVMTLGARDAILGNPDAPVTLIEYGDYQCPFCTQFFSLTQPQITTDYINKGLVKMVFRNFAFLGQESLDAAAAAECSEDQNKFWAYHQSLYTAKVADEQGGGGENDGFFSRAEFLKLAQQVGLDTPTFTSCLDSKKYVAAVTQERTDATKNGVNSTPTFYVSGQQILGAQPYATFEAAFETALKG